VQDRLYAMDVPPREFDEKTSQKLAKIAARRQKLEATAQKLGEGDEARLNRVQKRYELLEAEEQEIQKTAPLHFSEETKAVGTTFLILDPDGRVHREYRLPRHRSRPSTDGTGRGNGGAAGSPEPPKPPTSEDLSDTQLAVTFTHQALAVRQALLSNASARKRVLALILHEKVRSEALSVRHDANTTTLHANGEGFTSPAWDQLRQKRAKLDPFADQHFIEDWQAYNGLSELSGPKLDALVDVLTVECVTAHTIRRTKLVQQLADELEMNVRDYWRPDAAWLSGFQKIQLSQLIADLLGPVHAPDPERKKSELVEILAKLFADAAAGKLEDKQLAERVNRWLPYNLRQANEDRTKGKISAPRKHN